MQSEVDRITTLPEEAEEPQVTQSIRKREVISVVIYGDQDEFVLREMAESIRDQLLNDPAITQIDLSGVRDYQINIEIPQETLRRYNLTLDTVAAIIRDSAVELPGGGVKTSSGEILVRMTERRDVAGEFTSIPIISRPDGTVVTLGQIADISDGFADTDAYARFNNLPAVMLEVYRVGDQTPLEVAGAVLKQIDILNQTLPPGIAITTLRDMADIYGQRMDLLLRNGCIGLAIVFVLLGIFLEARLAFWVTMGIPISFLGGILLLPMFDVSINMISMFAFIVSLGIVVDDAIVVGENIYAHHQRGEPFYRAAILGAREVTGPVIFSVLTNIVAFLPLLFIPGFIGKIWKIIPLVITAVFTISLVESLLILPCHLGHQRDRGRKGASAWLHDRQQRFSHAFRHAVANHYGPFLDFTLRWRYVTVAVSLGILIVVGSYALSGYLGMEMMPKVESDYAQASIILPYGSAVAQTQALCDQLIAAGRAVVDEHGGDRLCRGMFTRVGSAGGGGGSGGSHTATVRIYLTDPEERPHQHHACD